MLYKDLNTGEIWTEDELKKAYEQFECEMEGYVDFEDYVNKKILVSDLEEVPQYTVFWVAGERDGEELFETDDYHEAIAKAAELEEKYEDEFDPTCGGVAIMDNETREPLEW